MTTEGAGADAGPLACPARPCPSCPYRLDHPSGVWAPAEYERLAGYDEVPGRLGAFRCHRTPVLDRPAVCVGWLAVHADGIAARLAVSRGVLRFEDVERAVATDVPLHPSGTAARDAGLAEVHDPGRAARRMMAKLLLDGVVEAPPGLPLRPRQILLSRRLRPRSPDRGETAVDRGETAIRRDSG